MQISLSAPSTPKASTTGCGCDALFDEVSQGSGDETSSDPIESFDALIQAALAALSGTIPQVDPLLAPTGGTETSAAPDGNTPIDAQTSGTSLSGAAGGAAEFAASTATVPASAEVGTGPGQAAPQPQMTSTATSATPPADIPVESSSTASQEGLASAAEGSEEETSRGLTAAGEGAEPRPEANDATDDMMLAVAESMESFTPIPASVLALMRADSVRTSGPVEGASTAISRVASGQHVQRPFTATESIHEGLDTEETEATEADLFSLVPETGEATTRTFPTDRFSSLFDEVEKAPSDASSQEPSPTSESAVPTTPARFTTADAPVPPGGEHRLPAVPATREALGAFAIEQIVARADSRDGEPVSRIEARIDPPELGRVSIEISRTAEGLSAHLTVDDPSVLALLDQQLRDVQQTLAAAGVPMMSLTMSAGSEGDSAQQQYQRDDEETPVVNSAQRNRSAGSRPLTGTRREIDTTV